MKYYDLIDSLKQSNIDNYISIANTIYVAFNDENAKNLLNFRSGITDVVLREIIHRLKKDEPLEYILGYIEIEGNLLTINKNVLIPREETVGLVDLFIQEIDSIVGSIKSSNSSQVKDSVLIFELGTGSGIIPILITKKLIKIISSRFHIITSEISSGAYSVGRINIERNLNELSSYVTHLISDGKNINEYIYIDDSGKYRIKNSSLDNFDKLVIISNPPYIRREKLDSLDSSVRDFEPIIALDGGESGIEYYQSIISFSSELNPSMMFFEIDQDIIDVLSEIVPDGYGSSFHDDIFGNLRYWKLNLK